MGECSPPFPAFPKASSLDSAHPGPGPYTFMPPFQHMHLYTAHSFPPAESPVGLPSPHLSLTPKGGTFKIPKFLRCGGLFPPVGKGVPLFLREFDFAFHVYSTPQRRLAFGMSFLTRLFSRKYFFFFPPSILFSPPLLRLYPAFFFNFPFTGPFFFPSCLVWFLPVPPLHTVCLFFSRALFYFRPF